MKKSLEQPLPQIHRLIDFHRADNAAFSRNVLKCRALLRQGVEEQELAGEYSAVVAARQVGREEVLT